MKVLALLVGFVILAMASGGCAQDGGPVAAVEAYLQARVASDANRLRILSCADWEAKAELEAASFKSMDARLEGMACREVGKDGGYTVVACDGKIVTTYNGESREWALSKYRAIQEGGEWKMCGEAE